MSEFIGAKVALLVDGDKVVVIQRDDKPDIPYAGLWDLPGSGRDGGETPFECVQREVREELDHVLEPGAIVWQREYDSVRNPRQKAWFMVAALLRRDVKRMTLGDEGQRWGLVPIEDFMASKHAVEPMQQRLQDYLDEVSRAAA